MSLDVLSGKPYDAGTDLWSAGIVLYEMPTEKVSGLD
jgi:serine/threonine protein kinase